MRREIKFKVWNNLHKKWVHGPNEEVNLVGETILLGEFMRVPIAELQHCVELQFTGLKDKNGQEIYEGDIIKVNSPYIERILDDGSGPEFDWFNIQPVIFKEGCFGIMFDGGEPRSSPRLHFATFNWLLNDFGIDDIEVIGNIFENTELLESDEEEQINTEKVNQ